MKKLLFISIVAFVAMSMNVSAKEPAVKAEANAVVNVSNLVIKGIVSDKTTNENLAGAVITVNGQKVYSDLDGNFVINNVCEGQCTIKVNLISYEAQTLVIDTQKDKSVQIKLSQL